MYRLCKMNRENICKSFHEKGYSFLFARRLLWWIYFHILFFLFKEAGKSFWELSAPNGKGSSPSGCQASLRNAKARGNMRPRRELSDVVPWELPTRKYSVLVCNQSLLFVVVFRACLTPNTLFISDISGILSVK
jgi:hypothetical protein